MIHKPCGPFNVTHTTTISPKCHHHTHLWANPKSQLYRPSTAKRYTFTSTKPPFLPIFATTDDVHLRHTAMSRHYDTFQLIISDRRTTPRPDFRWWPIFCIIMTHHPTAKGIVNACQNFAVANRVFLKDIRSCCSGLLHRLPTASSVCCFGFSVSPFPCITVGVIS